MGVGGVQRLVAGRGGAGLFAGLGPSGRRALIGGAAGSPGQVTRTTLRSRARALVNCSAHGQRCGEVQGEFAAGAGDPSGGAEVTSAEGVGGDRQAWTLAANAPDLQRRLRGWVVKADRGRYALSPRARQKPGL